MSDLISRQDAIDALKAHRALYCDNTPDTFSKLSYAEKSRVDELDTAIATLVNLPPAVDAVPVRHGEWSNRRTWTHDGEWYCTACDKEITIYMGEKRGNDRYKYCPNCGAKMDGERRDPCSSQDS